MRHSKVFMFALLCVCSLGSHKELAPGSPMGTKIHAYTSPWYRVASYSWPFMTMAPYLNPQLVQSMDVEPTHTEDFL